MQHLVSQQLSVGAAPSSLEPSAAATPHVAAMPCAAAKAVVLRFTPRTSYVCLAVWASLLSHCAVADPNHSLEQIEVRGWQQDSRSTSNTASSGLVGNADLALVPLQRPGDVLSTVPGMVVTQHSGSGKANQYFLRGFNLDHGTDFAVSLDGMPLNQRSHGHGQGYTDLNPLIPELVQQLSYQKGPYAAEAGDFSAAGSVQLSLQNLTRDSVSLTAGSFGFQRLLAKGDVRQGAGNWLGALELQGYDGPWRNMDEDVRKHSALLRYSQPLAGGSASVMLLSYQNRWQSADQLPLRAIHSAQLDLFDSLNPSSGGDSKRQSVSLNFKRSDVSASAYYVQSDLQLWSDFSYFLNDPQHGDQFEQADDRAQWGGALEQRLDLAELLREGWQLRLGVQAQQDQIGNVGLYQTERRRRLSTVREDQIQQRSQSIYAALQGQLTEQWLWQGSARFDAMQVRDVSTLAANSGRASDQLPSLKTSVGYSLSDAWSIYAAAGQAFHSNDARGAVSQQDPTTGEALSPVPLLVRTRGSELGARWYQTWQDDRGLNASLALWQLALDSELKYVGDAGGNEPSRASKRQGLELSSYFWAGNWQWDGQLAWSNARYHDEGSALAEGSLLAEGSSPAEGSAVEGAVPLLLTVGVRYQASDAWSLALQGRHIGGRRLDSHSQFRSASAQVVNAQLTWHQQQWWLQLDLLNLLNSRDADMSYAYSSRLADEAQAVEDIHLHPLEPRAVRLQLRRYF